MKVPIIRSKLPHVGTTIFTKVSAAAIQHHAINLAQGFPNFDCDPLLMHFVSHAMFDGYNQYAPMAGSIRLREAIANKMNNTYSLNIHPDHEITVTAGATQALFTAIASFVSAGDEVIIIEPCYDSYIPAIETMGAKAIPITTLPPNFSIDWQKVKDCITSKTKMFIANSPGNPSAKILSKSDYETLAELLDGTDIILLSDEVYEHLIYDGNLHTSPLSIEGLKDRTLSVFSFGKTFHNTGWKLGYCIAVEALMKEFRKVHQFNVFCANSFVQEGFANYMNQGCPWQELPSFYQEKRDKVVTALNQSKYKLLHSEGSFFILADYSDVSDKSDMEFINDMIIHQKIALIPLSVFYRDYPKGLNYVRICFAKTDEVLDQGIRALLGNA